MSLVLKSSSEAPGLQTQIAAITFLCQDGVLVVKICGDFGQHLSTIPPYTNNLEVVRLLDEWSPI